MCKASSVYAIQSHDVVLPSLITPPTTTPTHGKLGEQRMQSTRKVHQTSKYMAQKQTPGTQIYSQVYQKQTPGMELYSHKGLQTCIYTGKKLIPGMQIGSEEMYIRPANIWQEMNSRHASICKKQTPGMEVYSHESLQTCIYPGKKLIPGMQIIVKKCISGLQIYGKK